MANQTQLLSSRKSGDSSYTTTGIRQGLDTIRVDIEDTAHLSTYFQIVEFTPVFTAGKNSISFNGSHLLAENSEIKMEVLDAAGNSLYLTSPPTNTNLIDIANFTVAIHVFQETVNGPGQVFLVGTTTGGEVVRWTGNISINNTYKNASRTRFYYSPTLEVEPVLIPTIDITTGATLGISVVITGSCTGHSLNPYTWTSGGGNSSKVPDVANSKSSNYHVNWTTFSSSIEDITGFNSQMIGESILLYITRADNPSTNASNNIHSTQSFKISDVISPTEIRLDGDVVDTINVYDASLVSPSFTGTFALSYTQTSRVNQFQNIPFAGYFNTTNNTTQLVTNQPFFSASMVGNAIQVNYTTLNLGHAGSSYVIRPAISSSINPIPVTSSNFTVLNITNSYTGSIGLVSYTLSNSPNPHVISTTIYTASILTGTLTNLTESSPYQSYSSEYSSSIILQKSYADIVYKNLGTFSGFVARQKLYAQSNIYPGEFELISDTPITPSEMLLDALTANKTYANIGTFYDQSQVNTYWFPSSPALSLIQTDVPLMSGMTITSVPDYTAANGTNYVIAKVTAMNTTNDSNYYPYDSVEYGNVTGTGYTSNFICVQKGVLYSLTTNVVVNKNPSVPAKVAFYLTSSLPVISNEPNYNPNYGLLIGELRIPDNVGTKTFGKPQEFLFNPQHDYYGTLIIVPYQCNVTLANLSLVNYGDYGFSPGGAVIQVPFPLNCANESWTFKSELYDNNSNLVFTTSPIVQAFDPDGESLFGTSIIESTGTGSGIEFPTTIPQLTITSNLNVPGLRLLNPPLNFVAWNQSGGTLGYTDVSNISLIPTNTGSVSLDYINVELNGGSSYGRALAVRYSGNTSTVYGRRIYIDPSGNKTTYM
jgi:hypothetical protein